MRYLYISHHKCATQYTIQILREVGRALGLSLVNIDVRHTVEGLPQGDIESHDLVMLSDYTHGLLDLSSMTVPGFHVIRDPRDVLLSTYYSHKGSHRLFSKELARDRKMFKTMDVQVGMAFIMDHSSYFKRYVESMERWDFDLPHMYETEFVKVTRQPYTEFAAIMSHLGIDIDDALLRKLIDKKSFSNLKKTWAMRHPLARLNHYRKGEPGDWRNHLTGSLKKEFKNRYGALLIRLGYEQDETW